MTGLLPILPAGILVAGVVGWLSIRWLIGYVASHRLYAFALYCAAMGVASLLL